MARFRGTLQSDNRRTVSRLGTRELTATLNGWEFGVKTVLTRDSQDTKEDTIHIYLTSGSNQHGPEFFLGTFTPAFLHSVKMEPAG